MSFIDSVDLGELAADHSPLPTSTLVDDGLINNMILRHSDTADSWVYYLLIILVAYHLQLAYYYVDREYNYGLTPYRPVNNLILALVYIPMSITNLARSMFSACIWLFYLRHYIQNMQATVVHVNVQPRSDEAAAEDDLTEVVTIDTSGSPPI